MVAAAWRGEITPRLLRVYIDGLGEDDPRRRVDGYRWTTGNQLSWALIGEVKQSAAVIAASLGNKKPARNFEHEKYPWRKKSTTIRTGDRGDLSTEQALRILHSL